MDDLMIWSCFRQRSDCTIDWIAEEYFKPDGTSCVVNIYEEIGWSYELTNSQWQVFINSCSDTIQLLSILEYMALAEENVLRSANTINTYISNNC